MLKLWDFLSYCCIVMGVVCLIPLSSDGTLMLPLWASLSLIAFGATSEALFFALRHRRKQ